MSSPILDGLAELDPEEGTARLTLDAELYPLHAVQAACYAFLDRCWLVVGKAGADRHTVSVTPKGGPASTDALRAAVGELANELLTCAYRQQITTNNRAVIEAITTRAIAGAMGPPSLEDLESFDFSEEPFEDPLGIAEQWEHKHGTSAPEEEPK